VDSHVVGVSKPDPRIFAIALDRLGVPATSTWYVGDSPHHDLGGASAAGLGRVYLVDPLGLHQPRAGDDPVGSYQPWVGIVGSVADLVGRAEFAP
jgi:FMN phosphatase YigB (HAD superfamily)